MSAELNHRTPKTDVTLLLMLARYRCRQWNYYNVTFITTGSFFRINKLHQTKRIISKTCSLCSKRFRRVGEQEGGFLFFPREKWVESEAGEGGEETNRLRTNPWILKTPFASRILLCRSKVLNF